MKLFSGPLSMFNGAAWRIRMSERAAVKQVTGTMIAYLRRNNMYVPDFLEA